MWNDPGIQCDASYRHPDSRGGSVLWSNPRGYALPLYRSGRVGLVELLFLADFPFRNRIVRAPVVGRGGDTAARGDFDADVEHRHLGTGEGAHQHQLVEIPEMSDTEHLAGHLGKPRAQCEVVAAKRHMITCAPLKPSGTTMALTVSEYHFGS